MKRLALVIVLALLSNLASASLLLRQGWAGGKAVTSGVTVGATAIHHDNCHDSIPQDVDDSPQSGHHLLKCHTCCPAFGFSRPNELTVDFPEHGIVQTPVPSRPYTDITYTIDKPPKLVL